MVADSGIYGQKNDSINLPHITIKGFHRNPNRMRSVVFKK
jgi:hypothetical protein